MRDSLPLKTLACETGCLPVVAVQSLKSPRVRAPPCSGRPVDRLRVNREGVAVGGQANATLGQLGNWPRSITNLEETKFEMEIRSRNSKRLESDLYGLRRN